MVTNATIHIWGKRLETVVWDEKRNLATFEYALAFVRQNLNLSPFVMPVRARGSVFFFPELIRNEIFSGMPGLLADSLPDKFGNSLINFWIA